MRAERGQERPLQRAAISPAAHLLTALLPPALASGPARECRTVATPKEAATQRRFEPTAPIPELSARQSAVFGALRAKMDANKQVEAKAAVLAEAANIPLGSLHSILQSLEKKGLIKATRAGSARAPAAYQVA